MFALRTLLPPLSVFTVALVNAQPTIGPAQFFQEGHSYLRNNYDVHPDIAGSLVAADGEFYSIDLAWVNDAVLYTSDSIACVEAPGNYIFHPEYYDTANVQLTIIDRELGGTRQYLFLVRDDTVHYVGGQPNGPGGTGDDLILQQYPAFGFETVLVRGIEYGSTWTETIDAEFVDASGSDDHFITGTATTVADGAGQIILPDGTLLPHTLRLRTVHDYVDDNAIFGTIARTDTLYTWWVDSWDAPLMTLPLGHYAMMHGYVSPLPFALYTRLGNTSQGLTGRTAESLRVWPNPCSDRLFIGEAARGPYALLDMCGRTVLQGNSGGALIDISALAPGSYSILLGLDRPARVSFVIAR